MKKIFLIADSSSQTLEELQKQFSETNADKSISVITATDGLMLAQKTRNQKFDVIVFEWELSKLSELNLVQAIQSTSNHNTPLMTYTDKVQEVTNLCSKINTIAIYPKPFNAKLINSHLQGLASEKLTNKKHSINDRLINIFQKLTSQALDKLSQSTLKFRHLPSYEASEIDSESLDLMVSAVASVKSDHFSGVVAISFNQEVYLNFLKNLYQQPHSEINADNEVYLLNLMELIRQSLIKVSESNKFNLTLEKSQIFRGKNHRICSDSKMSKILVPFNSDAGKFFLQICVKSH